MALTVDSKPFFQSRAKVIGFDNAQIALLEANGVDSMASMTFMCNYQPSAPDDKPLVDSVIKIFTTDPPEPRVLLMVRRLHFEAHAVYLSHLKSRVTSTEDEAPRKIPVAERAARHQAQQAKLTGVRLEGEMECSHGLLDSVMQQHERNELKYIQINSCTSRDQEQSGVKKDSLLALDADGQITLKPSVVHAKVDTSTDFRVYQALNRRGLAYDQANLLDYMVHLKWIDYLFSSMQRRVPEGFSQVSYQQAMRADRELWRKMTDETRAGIVADATGTRPLDDALQKWMVHSDVLFFLLPMPSSSSTNRDHENRGDSWKSSSDRWNNNRYSPKGKADFSKGGGKGKKGNKGKGGKHGKGSYPASLPSGCVEKNDNGQKLCMNFNSVGCRWAKPGQSCRNGFHACARSGCFGNHSAIACAKAGN